MRTKHGGGVSVFVGKGYGVTRVSGGGHACSLAAEEVALLCSHSLCACAALVAGQQDCLLPPGRWRLIRTFKGLQYMIFLNTTLIAPICCQVRVASDSPRPGMVMHWAVGDWELPSPEALPPGSVHVADGRAVQASWRCQPCTRVHALRLSTVCCWLAMLQLVWQPSARCASTHNALQTKLKVRPPVCADPFCGWGERDHHVPRGRDPRQAR